MATKKYAAYYGQPQQVLKTWSAALYIRLSREDELKGESNSVSSQREILREYLKQHPEIVEYDCYVDDGWTGTNFERPGFQHMMQDIYAGKVNCVIVKDLSRFGRNANKGGELITEEFVRLRVRFIACNNYYDSLTTGATSAATDCITLGITNVINESVSATTSVNVRATLNVNRQQGKFIGSFPTYGYLKDPNDHHKLIVDTETAPIVRMIYEKFLSGESIIGIAKDLNEMGIPNPSLYKKLQGLNYKHPVGESNDGLWPDSSVRRVLQNEMYTGKMVQGKNRIISYKDQKPRACPKEEWYVVEGTHEAIIDQDTFDKAQALFGRNIRKSPTKKNVDLFAGLVRCADCGRIMNKKTNAHSYATYHYYRCATSRRMRKSACSNHTIRIDKMYDAVLLYLQQMINIAIELDKILAKINTSSKRQSDSSHLQKTLRAQELEREKCMRMMLDLYPDWKSGVITQEEYMLLKANIQSRMESLDTLIENLKKTASEVSDGVDSRNDFIAHFKQYGNIDSLTRPMLTDLIESIRVYEGGRIEINLNYRDAYEQVIEYIEMNKDIAIEVA